MYFELLKKNPLKSGSNFFMGNSTFFNKNRIFRPFGDIKNSVYKTFHLFTVIFILKIFDCAINNHTQSLFLLN